MSLSFQTLLSAIIAVPSLALSLSTLAFDDPRSSKGDCGLPCDDICVREGDSFRCDCSEVGKFLQSDGISCRSKRNGMAVVNWLFHDLR